MRPGFGVYKGLVVVVRRGCGTSARLRLSIFDMGYNLRWYLCGCGVWMDFLIKPVRKDHLDLESIQGGVAIKSGCLWRFLKERFLRSRSGDLFWDLFMASMAFLKWKGGVIFFKDKEKDLGAYFLFSWSSFLRSQSHFLTFFARLFLIRQFFKVFAGPYFYLSHFTQKSTPSLFTQKPSSLPLHTDLHS